MLTYRATLPTVSGGDVTSMKLLVEETLKDGTVKAIAEQDLETGDTEADFKVEQDSAVTLRLKVTDDAGNEATSEPLTFTATDTIPPVITGNLTISGPISED